MILGLRTETRMSKHPLPSLGPGLDNYVCALKGDLQESLPSRQVHRQNLQEPPGSLQAVTEYSQLRLSSALYSSSHPDPACRKQGRQGRPWFFQYQAQNTSTAITKGHSYQPYSLSG